MDGQRHIGIELGGTKIVCAYGSSPDELADVERIPTTTPADTLDTIAGYVAGHGNAAAIGVATFGPVDLDHDSPTYGQLTTTPKPGWAGADLVTPLREALDVPIALDTDVNGAALGELRWGAGQGLSSVAYATVGTGVGVGVVIDERPVHGLTHPEAGHLLPRRHPEDPFPGRCPTHGDCLEGLACGPAWQERWGATSAEMDTSTLAKAVEIEAWYLGQLVHTLVLTTSPQRVIIGGGVAAEPSLLPAVRRTVVELLNGYVDHPAITERIDTFVVAPGLGERAGVLGAIALAQAAT